MEVFLLIEFHKLQGWHQNNWKKKIAKGNFYSCDIKYTKGHKFAEKKLLYIDCEEREENEQESSKEEDIHQEPTIEDEEMSLNISCNALAGITTPQTLKIEVHIKKQKVIVLDRKSVV